MIYYLTETGNGCSPDGTLPAGAVVCTQAQYENAIAWTISNGAIVGTTPPAPTLAQQAASLLANGLAVTSAGTPAISATYATDAASIQKLIGVELSLAAGQGFPGGAATFPLRTVTGTPPQLTPAQYTAIGAKIRDFSAQADLVIDGLSTTLPPAAVTTP